MPLLSVRNLHVRFRSGEHRTDAVRDISFALEAGEILALVGESGSGKSVTSLALTRLLPPPPACEIDGEILYDGQDVLRLAPAALRRLRGKEIACVFQEPGTSLNPAFTVGFQIAEAIHQHFPDEKNVRARAAAALDEVGIRDASRRLDAYPHELSGGMQQRVMIAMALACSPQLLIADEPTTALDVTVQKQILDLLAGLRKNRGMAVLLITHNFGVVARFADTVAVMWRGRIVERGTTQKVIYSPEHEYTRNLIASIPRLRSRQPAPL
ncbi:MAG: ABC transporter ATP-binding protein [Puniceicoccales bacterium]|jgi:ABC-type dipeptide/oligopeptide/nickel transport system ATPase component|nr:ABC transporter ATP-binding protein [Puniceicoccales bacterium]